MTCIELRTYLNDYIDGTLSPERRAAVEANLPLCPDCQKELAGLVALASSVAALPKRIELARDLWPELSEKILTTAQMNQSLETTALAASDEFLDTERFRGIDYGALVLRRNYGAFMARGLGLSIAVIVLLFTSYFGYGFVKQLLEGDDNAPVARPRQITSITELAPPPPLDPQTPPPTPVAAAAPPDVGKVEQVKDEEAPKTQTLATQEVMKSAAGATGDSGAVGTGAVYVPPPPSEPVEFAGDPPDFVAVEKEPAFVNRVQPEYPDIARKAGMESRVTIMVLIDKDGKPLKTKILKGEEVFHESAVKAAMNSSYTPGVQNGQPIKVWMTIPYKFSLK